MATITITNKGGAGIVSPIETSAKPGEDVVFKIDKGEATVSIPDAVDFSATVVENGNERRIASKDNGISLKVVGGRGSVGSKVTRTKDKATVKYCPFSVHIEGAVDLAVAATCADVILVRPASTPVLILDPP